MEHTVRIPEHLHALHPRHRQVGEVEAAADVVHRHAVDDHLVEVGITASDEQRRRAASLARLHDLRTRHQPQRLQDVRLPQGLEHPLIDDRHRGADLRLGQDRGSRRDDHLLRQESDRKRDVERDPITDGNEDRIGSRD